MDNKLQTQLNHLMWQLNDQMESYGRATNNHQERENLMIMAMHMETGTKLINKMLESKNG